VKKIKKSAALFTTQKSALPGVLHHIVCKFKFDFLQDINGDDLYFYFRQHPGITWLSSS